MEKADFKAQAFELHEKLKGKIEELNSQLAAQGENADELYHDVISDLKEQKEELKVRLEGVDDMADGQWEEVKNWFASNSDIVKEGLEKVEGYFS